MNRSAQRRLERVEQALAARSLNNQEEADLGTNRPNPFAPKYTDEQLSVAKKFESWFAAEFPPVSSEKPLSCFLDRKLLPPLIQQEIFYMARSEFMEWWASVYRGAPCPDHNLYSHLIDKLELQIYCELYGDDVPIRRRCYFFHPDNLSHWASRKDDDGSERLPGFDVVTLAIICRPKGNLLKRACKFSSAWRRHDPTRRLAGLLSMAEEAEEGLASRTEPDHSRKRAVAVELCDVPENWQPPGLEYADE